MNVTYFVDNKLGGVTSLNYNLVSNPLPATSNQTVVHITQKEWPFAPANIPFPATEINFEFTNKENYYKVLARLRNTCPDDEGCLILNYDNEMAMIDHHPVSQTTYQLVHDDYNVGLAKKYGHIVDVFICHNSHIQQQLLQLFPQRQDRVFLRPHGVRIYPVSREVVNADAPLKLVFLGRMVKSKGIFDLLKINDLLRERSVTFEWLCIGNGPELSELKKRWNPLDKVVFAAPATNEEVMRLCARCDVFVLPTKFEGSPVSLLEAMSTGLVPVVTDLPGGITDVVTRDVGFRILMDDCVGFAEVIRMLSEDRALLKTLGLNARECIEQRYDIEKTAAGYHELFLRYKQFYNVKKLKKIKVGARLDQPFLPSVFTRFVRSFLKT